MKLTQTEVQTKRRWFFLKNATRKQRGVAIITVMAVIVLMSSLVLSFFAMAKHEQISARFSGYTMQNYAIRDVALNYAIGQLRQATTWRDPNNTAGYTVWTSQPGMIRTFSENGNLGKLFKLYSAKQMILDGTIDERNIEQEDMPKTWRSQTAVWVDLNKPIYKQSPNPMDGTSGGSRDGNLVYPIIDPNGYNPSANEMERAEGFSYDDGVVEGADTNKHQLAMPVRWIYILGDGTMGTVAADGAFSASGGRPTADNPIIARFAFWTDDECCKININTASEGVFWDIPRAASPEDAYLADCQPARNEFQRFPGHPATVCLSSVLFPNRRFYPEYSKEGFRMKNNTDDLMSELKGNELAFLWDIGQHIGYRGGTIDIENILQGKIRLADLSNLEHQVKNEPQYNKDDRFFASADEMLFRALTPVSKTTTSGDSILERALFSEESKVYGPPYPTTEAFIKKIRESQFLLTAKSSAPEVNMFGHPKISLWPVNVAVPKGLFNPSIVSNAATAFDSSIARLSSLIMPGDTASSENFYFLSRLRGDSRHNELQEATDGRKRIIEMFRYLKRATGEPLDGMSYAKQIPGQKAENNFLQKYPMVGDLGGGRNASEPEFSDRDCILANMLDYIRQTNLADPFLAPVDRYGAEPFNGLWYGGQNTNYCFCGWKNRDGSNKHLQIFEDANFPMPKGFGRLPSASEVILLVKCLGQYDSTGTLPAGADKWNGLPMTNFIPASPALAGARAFEIGFLVEAFIPGQGAAGVVPRVSANIGFGDNIDVAGNASMTAFPLSVSGRAPASALNTPLKPFLPAASVVGDPGYKNTTLDQYSRFGGYSGFRPFANSTPSSNTGASVTGQCLISFQPFALTRVAATGWELQFTNPTNAGGKLRLQLFDKTYGTPTANIAASDSNEVQCFYFDMSTNFKVNLESLQPDTTGSIHSTLLPKFGTAQAPNTLLDGITTNRMVIQSFVIPHGDYRISAATRTAGRGTPQATPTSPRTPWNSLVPLPPNKTLLWEPDFGWSDSLAIKVASTDPNSGGSGELCKGHRNPGLINKYRPDMPMGYEQYEKYLNTTAHVSELVLQRGKADPFFTGDFDNGVGRTPDGPYSGRNDEGDLRPYLEGGDSPTTKPYFDKLNMPTDKGTPVVAGSGGAGDVSAAFAPNKMIRSSVQFGSLPTGVNSNWPWQTLLFRPDPNGAPNQNPNKNGHYGGARWDNVSVSSNRRMPKDHLLLDFFWMPIVEPFNISAAFETKGKINMNYHIWPFRYIHRNTALHALFKSERIMAIPDTDAPIYKERTNLTNQQARYRHFIDAKRTLNQFERKFNSSGEFAGDESKVFKFPSEICELWLVPEIAAMKNGTVYEPGELNAAKPGEYKDDSFQRMANWWADHSLTGDNTKESPYANLYPRLTTRSNVYKVHMWVQTIQKVASTPPDKFVVDKDQITSDYRGSAVVERNLDTTDPDLVKNDFFNAPDAFRDPRKSLDYFYSYRVSEVKQFTP